MLTIGYWALLSVVPVERQRQGFDSGETYCVGVSFPLKDFGIGMVPARVLVVA